MVREVMVTMVPTRSETRLLVTVGRDEVMKARLGPAEQTHPRAAPMLLEALALWYQKRVHAVISVGADAARSDLGLADGLGYGAETVHYDVAWVDARLRTTDRDGDDRQSGVPEPDADARDRRHVGPASCARARCSCPRRAARPRVPHVRCARRFAEYHGPRPDCS
jgi:hypothetical protein